MTGAAPDELNVAYRAISGDHPDDWLTWTQAAELVGCPVSTIDWHARTGRISKRPQLGQRPTLERASVEAFKKWWEAEKIRRVRQPSPGISRQPTERPGYATLREAGEQLAVRTHHVPYLVRTGKLVAEHVHGRWWVEQASLEQCAAERACWISRASAQQLTDIAASTIGAATDAGLIVRRGVHRSLPSLYRASVLAWAEQHRELQRSRAAARAKRPSGGPPPDGHVWLDTAAAALVLRVTVQRVRHLAAAERLPATRRGGQWWLRRDHLEHVRAAQVARPPHLAGAPD